MCDCTGAQISLLALHLWCAHAGPLLSVPLCATDLLLCEAGILEALEACKPASATAVLS